MTTAFDDDDAHDANRRGITLGERGWIEQSVSFRACGRDREWA
jgi:hypothetical protein